MLALFFVGISPTVYAQSEDVSVPFPAGEGWRKTDERTEEGGSIYMQRFQPDDATANRELIISSWEKGKQQWTLDKVAERISGGDKKEKLLEKTDSSRLFTLATERRGSTVNNLIYVVEGKTAVHALMASFKGQALSPQLTGKWTKILQSAKISSATTATYTRFSFQVDDPAFKDNDAFRETMVTTLSDRLKGIYKRGISSANILVVGNTVSLLLRGDPDTAAIVKALTWKTDVRFLGGYAEVQPVIKQLKAKDTQKVLSWPPVTIQAVTYVASFFARDSAVVKALLKQVAVPRQTRWYTAVNDDIHELYLLDTTLVAVNSNELAYCGQYLDEGNGQPGVQIILKDSGREGLKAYTTAHNGDLLAIVSDDRLIKAAIIRGVIAEGSMIIAGLPSVADAYNMQRMLGYPYPVQMTFKGIGH
ncbi:MAG TPA: hypothetical protein VM802_19910 [Chitinophaga sp.]|uniref:SecDF P1 head subdomain-containing protein n=1 Tax=Chitinophaga sp. TaxID=1869181 RepID=UPI002CAF5C0A|nr:hypothetical protein [Chitinophaga sp.]HVI47153.1 hypothetical protein [Chitinophaga sp.]